MKQVARNTNPSPVSRVRKVEPLTRLLLFVRAGGRCEFDGCNEYLMEHHVTLTEGNFAQMAHIVAFKPDGPRGRSGKRPTNINDINNLMLLCPACHIEIDRHPGRYTRSTLEEYKRAHEERIKFLTELGPDRKTAALIFKAPIGGQTVAVAFEDVVEATAPRYPSKRDGTTIDLTSLSDNGHGFIEAARETIVRELERFFAPHGEAQKVQHVSVFALGPIPLLVFLGRQLTNKVPSEVFQRHRSPETWKWKRGGKPVRYTFGKVASGLGDGIALLLSLSGKIKPVDLPNPDAYASIYEISLSGTIPKPTCLRLRRDLDLFREIYQEAIGTIIKDHGRLVASIDLFPAVPAPVAVLCGRELLPKVHPRLRVYDRDAKKVGYQFVLEV